MAEAPFRLAVVGCGAIANAYAEAASRVDGLFLAAAIDRDARAASAFAAARGARAFAGLEEFLHSGLAVDGALVLTPPDAHESVSTALLQRGLPVLCEKPLARSLGEARRMLAVARDTGRLLMMGSKFRYTPDVARSRELVEQGLLGPVALYENVFCARVDMRSRWNAKPSISGGGVLIDNGCHSVDVARFLLGPIARVQAMFGKPIQPLEVEDTARVLFESRSGAMGSVDLSWSLHKEDPAYVRLFGKDGMLEIGWKQSRYRLGGDSEWTTFGHGYDKVAAFAAQIANFRDAALRRAAPVITDADALASVQVIDEAYRSAREQKWHELPSTDGPLP